MRKLLSAALALALVLAPAYATPFNRSLQNWQRIAAIKKKITIAPTGPTGFAVHWDQAAMWYTPIPGTATYTNIHISGDPGSTGIYASNTEGVDDNYEITASNSDPVFQWLEPTSWQPRSPGTTPIHDSAIHIPNSFTLADATSGNTPNNPTIYYNSTTSLVYYINACTRVSSTSNMQGYENNIGGRNTGSHGGSGTSGGYISAAELTAGKIPHAIGVMVYAAKYLSNNGTGYVAPALTADSYYATGYGGTDTTFKMGSRLAIPAGTSCSSLGAGSGDALTVCTAFKTYGGLVVDDSGFSAFYVEGLIDADTRLYSISSTVWANMFGAMQHVRGAVTGD